MDFELRAAKEKWEKEQREKKERARARIEREKKARDEAAKRQEAIETAQRLRRLEESAALDAVSLSSPVFFFFVFYVKNSHTDPCRRIEPQSRKAERLGIRSSFIS
jgi:hypothetical protein